MRSATCLSNSSPDGMTESVVDLLEAVEVQHKDVEFLPPPAVTRASVFDFFDQGRRDWRGR